MSDKWQGVCETIELSLSCYDFDRMAYQYGTLLLLLKTIKTLVDGAANGKETS